MYHSAALTGMRQLHEGGVAEYEMLQMEVDDLNGLRSDFLRIGAFSSVATHWLPRIIHTVLQLKASFCYRAQSIENADFSK